MTLLAKPNQSCDETQEAVVARGEFVEAREDAPKVFSFTDKTFDQVTLFVQVPVNLALLFAVSTRRNHCFRALFCDAVDEVRRIVAGVGNQRLELIRLDECRSLRNVVTFASRQAESKWQTERIRADVNFSGKATATPT